ncbi:hypothetical protein HF521_016806 [Silurus meridionalis]|uniref:Epidermal growth factor-like protein 6 n=1 Tax=Silurus meridionalis TaxID=175797 RepID=A0A8T0BWT6_SILME|nr:hypothetical protein HF521_016806 [Silurus meridionalis]
MKPCTWISSVTFLLYVLPASAASRQSRQVGNLQGVCRYGSRLECCYGWKKNTKGQCEAQCEFGCKHGECVGPNKCKCFPGYSGKACSQDLNECGLKPRPCEHRCMNTFGSYMCYCLNGYMLMSDGSCANSRTCSVAHCQYGCEEVQGEIRCLCPSTGLQLSSDGKTCVDIDECVAGKHQCLYNRECVNTFGSYYCKCPSGYDLKYISGKYDCVDINECLANTHKCSRHAECLNTEGSYKCKCTQGFRGNGFECSVKPFYHSSSWDSDKGSADEVQNGHGVPNLHLQPFDYDGDVYIGQGEEVTSLSPTGEEEEGNGVDGERLTPRGDVFFPDVVFSRGTEFKEIKAAPLQERFLTDCDFDSGECEWVQEQDDDVDWIVRYHQNGLQYYMALSGTVGNRREQARLKLLLSDAVRLRSFCVRFSYRLPALHTGTLRVLTENGKSHSVLWEGTRGLDQGWNTENLDVTWSDRAPESVVFEGTLEKLVRGEMGLDHVVLMSGSCSDAEDKLL